MFPIRTVKEKKYAWGNNRGFTLLEALLHLAATCLLLSLILFFTPLYTSMESFYRSDVVRWEEFINILIEDMNEADQLVVNESSLEYCLPREGACKNFIVKNNATEVYRTAVGSNGGGFILYLHLVEKISYREEGDVIVINARLSSKKEKHAIIPKPIPKKPSE